MNRSNKIRLGTWYHLNAAPQAEWEADIRTIKALGYDYVGLAWGIDVTLIQKKAEDTLKMLALLDKYGLGGYLCVWSAIIMYPHVMEGKNHQQVDSEGHLRNYYNLYHRDWRAGDYKRYLQEIAKSYRDCPALLGYVFDDTFHTAPAQGDGYGYISYSEYDLANFQHWLKNRYKEIAGLNSARESGSQYRSWTEITPPRDPKSDPLSWKDWTEARADWLEEWARDTKDYIHQVDPKHEIFVLDGYSALTVFRDVMGLDFGRVIKYFDVVEIYSMPSGFDTEKVDMDKILSQLAWMVSEAKRLAPGKRIVCDFHVYVPFGKDLSWPYPSLEQIAKMTEQGIASGANRVQHYGYRTVDWRNKKVPSYPVVPEVKTMLHYRKDIHKGLKEFNRRITGK